MALNLILRRASNSITLAIRAGGSERTIPSAVSAVLSLEKSCLNRSSFIPFSQFSTKPSSDENLIRVIESEINCAEQPSADEIPDGFPFKIEDNPRERTVLLTREYLDEIIKVEADMPNPGDFEEDEDDDGGEVEKSDNRPSIPLVVNISKGNGVYLEFGVTAFPDEIIMDSLSMKQPEGSEDHLAYEGPDCNDLDENLEKAFYKYLEMRGIKLNTTNFLHKYMINKNCKEYLRWLKNLKKFVEK